MNKLLTATAALALAAGGCAGRADSREQDMTAKPTTKPHAQREMPPLTAAEQRIIVDKGTEMPFTGKYWNTFEKGSYVCRRCGATLYRSADKFKSTCGWPSFDDEVPGAVKRQLDTDGRRTEIVCAACGAHLGHVFLGENLTARNTRHCVNSASIVFVPASEQTSRPAKAPASQPATKSATARAIFAGGCFWGVEHYFQQVPGVISVTSGYCGGHVEKPTYKQVCTGTTGHAESVEVVFDPAKVTYEQLARLFFEIHDPTTPNRQGLDVGSQYRSAVFYLDEQQRAVVDKLIARLTGLGYKVTTEVAASGKFWPAEDYHQDYFVKHPGRGDCHVRVPRFDKPAR